MIQNISVIGAGTMGHGIAHVFARHGYKVRLYDPAQGSIERAAEKMREELQFLVEEAYIMQDDVETTLSNIELLTDLEAAVKEADYVIESIPERMDLKKELFKKLDLYCPAHTVFATNTSSLKLSEMIDGLPKERRARCMVCHWYNPAYLIPLVELSFFDGMDEQAFADVYELYEKSKKQPIRVLEDVTGMVANRLSHSLAREVFNLIDSGIATSEDVDKALKYGVCFRYATAGIPECADMGGLDIWCATEDNIFPTLNNRECAFDSMRQHVKNGELGIKSGKGFYDYPEDKREEKKLAFNKRLVTQLKASAYY